MTHALKAVVARAYEQFKRYKVQQDVDACTVCCISESQANDLKSLAPRYIPHQLLYDYNTAAKPAKLDLNEFKHFLPRFMELVAERQFLSHSTELSFVRFDYFKREEWETAELDLFTVYACELFRSYLSTYPIDPIEEIDSLLVMLGKTYVDINQVLDQWLIEPSVASVLHLNDLLHAGTNNGWAFTFDTRRIGPLIMDWTQNTLFDHRFRELLEGLILEPGDRSEHDQRELSATYSTLGF